MRWWRKGADADPVDQVPVRESEVDRVKGNIERGLLSDDPVERAAAERLYDRLGPLWDDDANVAEFHRFCDGILADMDARAKQSIAELQRRRDTP